MQFPKEILETEGNDKCADCNTPNPSWSVTNVGTFICIQCAGKTLFKFQTKGVHRNLGAHISKILSTKLDLWPKESVEFVKTRGNNIVNSELESELKTEKINEKTSMFELNY
jgi:hypothetical protein